MDVNYFSINMLKCNYEQFDQCLKFLETKLKGTPIKFIKEVTSESCINAMVQKNNQYKNSFIVWEPLNFKNTLVFYSNLIDGWLTLNNVIGVMCEIFVLRISVFEMKPNELYCFEIIDGKVNRIIQLIHDKKWIFTQRGDSLPFENLDRYKEKLAKNRLNKEMLLDYAMFLGWNVRSSDFWKTENKYMKYEQFFE